MKYHKEGPACGRIPYDPASSEADCEYPLWLAISWTERKTEIMTQITVGVDGMQCGMCEAHINEAVRGAFKVKKVTSSHSKGETVIFSETPIDEGKLREAITKIGYTVTGIKKETYEKKGLFSFLHK